MRTSCAKSCDFDAPLADTFDDLLSGASRNRVRDDVTLNQEIEELIRSANRYTINDLRAKLDALFVELRKTHPLRATQMEAEHFFVLGWIDYSDAIARLQEVVEDATASASDLMFAYSTLAKITRGRVDDSTNDGYRQNALMHARAIPDRLRELVTQVNWGITKAEDGLISEADDHFRLAESLLPLLSDEERSHRVVAEVRSRRAAISGKISLRGLSLPVSPSRESIYQAAMERFQDALRAVPGDVHRQVNTRIEQVAELIDLGLPWYDISRPDIVRVLDEAHRALDAHVCENCEAYFLEVAGRAEFLQGRADLVSDIAGELTMLRSGIEKVSEAERKLRSRGHPKADELARILKEMKSVLSTEMRPRKIFLSHSGRDKAMVREVRNLLTTLGFEPWLDEDAMAAGVTLERGLLAGMEESCAAVFFVTENFRDENYLATEIEYAVAEKRKKGSHFAIVTLVLSDSINVETVPALLRRFVFKRPLSQFDAITEIIRALPLAPSRPQWRDGQNLV